MGQMFETYLILIFFEWCQSVTNYFDIIKLIVKDSSGIELLITCNWLWLCLKIIKIVCDFDCSFDRRMFGWYVCELLYILRYKFFLIDVIIMIILILEQIVIQVDKVFQG